MGTRAAKDEPTSDDTLVASTNPDLPPDARQALSKVASDVVRLHQNASDEKLRDYVSRQADGRNGASLIFSKALDEIFQGTGNLELLEPENQERFIDSVSELATGVGEQVSILATDRIGVTSKVASKTAIEKFVREQGAKRIWSEAIPLNKLTSKLEAARQSLAQQGRTRGVALVDVSAVGHNYKTVLKSAVPQNDKWGWFQAADCPLDDATNDPHQTRGFHEARKVVAEHTFTVIWGVENWRKEFTDITKFVRHWAKSDDPKGETNRLIILPFGDKKNKTMETVTATLIANSIPLIYLPIEHDTPDVEPINWDEKFGDYSETVKSHAREIAKLIYEDVAAVIRPELNERQVQALDLLDASQITNIQDELAENARSLSLDAQRSRAKKRILNAVLKASTPTYSIKRNPDPLTFYQQHLEPWFKRFGHPITSLNEAAPNLSRTLRERKAYPQNKNRTNRKLLRS